MELKELNEAVSDISSSSSESSSSSDEEGFSLLLDSAILGKGGRNEKRRQRKIEREKRRKERVEQRAARMKIKEEVSTAWLTSSGWRSFPYCALTEKAS